MSNSGFQSLLMESGGSLEPVVPTCVADPYYSCGPTNDPYWTDVVLMLHMDGTNGSTTFTDSSTAAEVMNDFGSAALSTTEKKFGTAALALNGTTDYIAADASNTNYDFGSSNFTVECWVYSTEAGRRQTIISNHPASPTRGWVLYKDTSNRLAFIRWAGTGSGASMNSGSLTIPLNQWVHIAVTRQAFGGSNFIRLFVNGRTKGFISGASSISASTGTLIIGSDPSSAGREFAGYIDDVRITRNQARYWGGYNVPTEAFPDALDSDFDPDAPRTVFSLHGEAIEDSSCYQEKTITAGGTSSTSATQAKFGSTSLEVLNTGVSNANGFTVTAHQDLMFFAGDWTFEMWVYRIANTYIGRIFTGLDSTSMYAEVGTDGLLDVVFNTSAGTQSRTNITTIPTGQWVNIVFQRRSDFFETYVDGTRVDNVAVTGGSSSTMDDLGNFFIGKQSGNSSSTFNGYFDEVRLTKGVARYTADFDVATLPNCDSTSAGGEIPTSGTDYPVGQTATVQAGQLSLATHYQPLVGSTVTVRQKYLTLDTYSRPEGTTDTYTTTKQLTSTDAVTTTVLGTLTFNLDGSVTFINPETGQGGNGEWLSPVQSGASDEYQIRITIADNPNDIYDEFPLVFNTWNELAIPVVIPFYTDITLSQQATSGIHTLQLQVEIKPKNGSPLAGSPGFVSTLTINLNFLLTKPAVAPITNTYPDFDSGTKADAEEGRLFLWYFNPNGTITSGTTTGTVIGRWIDAFTEDIASKYRLVVYSDPLPSGFTRVVPATNISATLATSGRVRYYNPGLPGDSQRVGFTVRVYPTLDNPRYGEAGYLGQYTFTMVIPQISGV